MKAMPRPLAFGTFPYDAGVVHCLAAPSPKKNSTSTRPGFLPPNWSRQPGLSQQLATLWKQMLQSPEPMLVALMPGLSASVARPARKGEMKGWPRLRATPCRKMKHAASTSRKGFAQLQLARLCLWLRSQLCKHAGRDIYTHT